MSRRACFAGVMLAVAMLCSSSSPLLAADEDRLEWQFFEADDPNNKSQKTAHLIFGVPETDAVRVTGSCDGAAGADANLSKLTFSADIGQLEAGREVDLRFSGGGVEHTTKGHVHRTEGGEGLTGVALSVEHSDPLWTLLTDKKQVDYLVPGYGAGKLNLERGQANIQKFISACKARATASASTASNAATDADKSNAEKDAFNSAKELGTADAWTAYLANYPSGFRADLARAYLKKLGDGTTPGNAAVPTDAASTLPPGVGQAIAAKLPVAVSGNTHEISCKEKPRSKNNNTPAKVTFVNTSGMYRSLLWLDFKGQPTSMTGLNPGEQVTVETFVTHPWMVATGPGDCLQLFMPSPGVSTVVLGHHKVDDGDEEEATQKTPAKTPAVKKKTPLDYARENCKETGGYWTGSTCKASKNAKIGKCKPGYVWSSEAGACQWDGGPPKNQPAPPQQNSGQQIQQLIQNIQDAKKQAKCKAPRVWDQGTRSCDCPGDSVFKNGKCVKDNGP
jgi:hypothetical protein